MVYELLIIVIECVSIKYSDIVDLVNYMNG